MSKKGISSQCYGPEAWGSYQAGILTDSESLRMAEHLLECDYCMDMYLKIIDNKLQEGEVPKLSKDFTDRMLSVIKQDTSRQKAYPRVSNISDRKDKEVHSSKINVLISYCAAAGIAMFFWVGGYFDDLSGQIAKGIDIVHLSETIELRDESQQSFIRTGWTKNTSKERYSSFIDNLILKKE